MKVVVFPQGGDSNILSFDPFKDWKAEYKCKCFWKPPLFIFLFFLRLVSKL